MDQLPHETVPEPKSTRAPGAGRATGDLLDSINALQWRSAVLSGCALSLWGLLPASIGAVLGGLRGLIAGEAIALAVGIPLMIRLGSGNSYRRAGRMLRAELEARHGMDFGSAWLAGYARGRTRGWFLSGLHDDSEDLGFLRVLPDRLEFYGIRTSLGVPRQAVVEAGLCFCPKACFISLLALCGHRHRPFVAWRDDAGKQYAVNFEVIHQPRWPQIMENSAILGRLLAEWVAKG